MRSKSLLATCFNEIIDGGIASQALKLEGKLTAFPVTAFFKAWDPARIDACQS
jgi:hypothetical protein